MNHISVVLHSCEFLQKIFNIPQTNIIPLLDRFIKHGEKLPIFKNYRFPNFSANLWLWILCCFGPYILDRVWFTSDGKVFWYHTLFQKIQSFLYAFAMSLQGVLSLVDECSCLYYDSIVDLAIHWKLLKYISKVVLPVRCLTVKSLSLSFISSV